MRDELLEVLARLLDFGGEDDRLLEPVRGLHEVVGLELEGHLAMRVLEPKVLGLVPLRGVSESRTTSRNHGESTYTTSEVLA
jgi:hypothetical protein